ncbi:MAG TPA: bifunctional phosphoribosylaminoimidazolecarboxamide formyltransferase/IMP cyclohydrolase [Acidimicrobiales bacterium]|nr:bifunctional phosphoribosylaminoimidazolecarboxamide formyltransferase/IMP cyclohydrolase [Acidimicrobiales bacterium]
MRALLSVSDKTGLVALARGLAELGWELVASGGTASALAQADLTTVSVEEVTGSPALLGGRVKTLHPRIHGGILADRGDAAHRADLVAHGIEGIDLVVCNLYPFRERPGIETIDIGGPTMVRAAAKNHAWVGVVVDPADYPPVLEELGRDGGLSPATRLRLARAAFAHTAAYDAAIVAWLDSGGAGGDPELLPPTLHLALERAQDLRYGENPHQRGARYREIGAQGWWDGVVQHAGMGLSYLNLVDAEAAWRLVHDLAATATGGAGDAGAGPGGSPAAVTVIKHANPCGAALATSTVDAYAAAVAGDPVSAFGGIVALSAQVTAQVAEAMVAGPQADVVVAPGYEPAAVETLVARRRNTRLLEAAPPGPSGLGLRRVDAGFLVQEPDPVDSSGDDWQVATKAVPTAPQWRDLRLAWVLGAATSSNAVVVVSDGQLVGVGAGQANRVEAAQIAVGKAGARAVGAAAASDAFFPFRDGLDRLAEAGVTAVAQPGGSVRDGEVVAAADEAGMAMVLTGRRHFRH